MKIRTIAAAGAILAAALGLAACGSASDATASPTVAPGSQTAVAPRPSTRTYPGQAADVALCNTFNTHIQTGDAYDIGVALQQAAGTISPKLATDVQAVMNGGSLHQDLIRQIHVIGDCALAKVGVQP